MDLASDFVGGLWERLKTKFWDLVNFVLHPVETVKGIKYFAVALFVDWDGTTSLIIDQLKGDFSGVASGDAKALGKLIGKISARLRWSKLYQK